MPILNITFKHTNVSVDQSLDNLVKNKLTALDKYIGDETDVKCEIEFERLPSHKSGPICRVEANLWVKGSLYRAETTEETFEAGVDSVKDSLHYEMKKAHQKKDSLVRRGGRKLKEMMRFGK
jgi:ribosomal subunit interface protein